MPSPSKSNSARSCGAAGVSILVNEISLNPPTATLSTKPPVRVVRFGLMTVPVGDVIAVVVVPVVPPDSVTVTVDP